MNDKKYDRYLLEGEEILAVRHQFPSVLFWPAIIFLIVAIGEVVGIIMLPKSTPTWVGIVFLVIFLLAAISFFLKYLSWRSIVLVLTSNRVLMLVGFFTKEVRDLPLAKIQSISIKQNLFERMMRSGTLILDSGGQASEGLEALNNVMRIHEFYKILSEQLK